MVLRKSYLDKIIPFIDQDLIKVLVGIRRCGKTVLLGQIKDVLLQRNIPAQNIIQANFEPMRFRNTRTAETLYDYIAKKRKAAPAKFIFFWMRFRRWSAGRLQSILFVSISIVIFT